MNKYDTLGWVLIYITLLSCIMGYAYLKIDKDRQIKEITIYKKEVVTNLQKDYFGYIYFKKTNVKRLIKYGEASTSVNLGYIGIFNKEPDVFPRDPLILVGHSRLNLFASVHQLQVSDVVIINTKQQDYTYHVIKKIIIDANDLSFLKEIKSYTLVLITCVDDNQKRVVVMCEI